jgi:hypothetical protein
LIDDACSVSPSDVTAFRRGDEVYGMTGGVGGHADQAIKTGTTAGKIIVDIESVTSPM